MKFPQLTYNFFIVPALYVGFRMLALFSPKIRRGISGRKNLFPLLQNQLDRAGAQKKIIVIHAASMGEFEQARPVLRMLKQRFPDMLRCVSVFSPSAYDHLHNHPQIDILTYLPFDSWRAVRKFLKLLRPVALIFVRYDLWPNLLWQAQRQGIRTVLIDASVQETSLRHKPVIRHFNRAVFAALDLICVISQRDAEQLRRYFSPHAPIEITGDTRFDQVVFRAKEKALTEILSFPLAGWSRVLVAGSTWPEDEGVVLPAFATLRKKNERLKLLLAPHEPSEKHLADCEKQCHSLKLQPARLSQYRGDDRVNVLLVDRIGILANLYAAAQVAFVGGSFGPGVHNVIEAAAHGVPVVFGPNMRNSPEALAMVDDACGFVVANESELCRLCLKYFSDGDALADARKRARAFVAERTGAGQRVVDLLENVL